MAMRATKAPDRATILDLLWAWVRQRPGLKFGNYGEVSAYRSEMRRITRQRHDAERLLGAVARSSMTVECLLSSFLAYSGRLSLVESEGGGWRLDYCTGQYWPTEYRAAAAAVLAAALWDHFRDDFAASAKVGESAGDAIRRNFRREFGATLQRRWFD